MRIDEVDFGLFFIKFASYSGPGKDIKLLFCYNSGQYNLFESKRDVKGFWLVPSNDLLSSTLFGILPTVNSVTSSKTNSLA